MAGLASEAPRVGAPSFPRARGILPRSDLLDAVGRPAADPLVEHLSKRVAALATIWFGLVSFWEIGGPIGAGHVSAASGVAIAADNMLRWGLLGPVAEYHLRRPEAADYYCHHPWGIFWTTAVLMKIFGRHDFICRLAPALMSSAMPPLLYGIGRTIWSPLAGAVAALALATLPIALAFSNFNALEVPVMFGVLVATWGYVRFATSWRRRFALVSLFGLAIALNADWPAYFFAAPVLAFMLVRVLVLQRWFKAVDIRRFAQWWISASALCVGVILLYAYLFRGAGQLTELISQGNARSSGWERPLEAVLESRAYWIELSFTPLAIFIGKLAAPILILRLVILRHDLEVFPLAILVMAAVQYVVFKQGADIHIFWPHLFAPYYALALAAIAASVEASSLWLLRRFRVRRGARIVSLATLGIWLLVPLATLPDGIRALNESRMTGGRFNEHGLIIYQDLDKVTFLRWLGAQMESDTSAVLERYMRTTWSLEWALHHPTSTKSLPTGPKTGEDQYIIADARFVSASTLKPLADAFYVRVVGPFWVADRGVAKAPIDGFTFEAREPNRFEWCVLQAHDPIRAIVPDAFHTWELRDHFGQQPNPPPSGEPRDLEQRRILHNVALATGNRALAERLLHELSDQLDRRPAADLTGGTWLLGQHIEWGVSPSVTLFFLSGETPASEKEFVIRSVVVEKPRWSLVRADDKDRVLGMPFAIPTTLWKNGYIYASVVEIRKRPGRERFYGQWTASPSPPPVPVPGRSAIELFKLD